MKRGLAVTLMIVTTFFALVACGEADEVATPAPPAPAAAPAAPAPAAAPAAPAPAPAPAAPAPAPAAPAPAPAAPAPAAGALVRRLNLASNLPRPRVYPCLYLRPLSCTNPSTAEESSWQWAAKGRGNPLWSGMSGKNTLSTRRPWSSSMWAPTPIPSTIPSGPNWPKAGS